MLAEGPRGWRDDPVEEEIVSRADLGAAQVGEGTPEEWSRPSRRHPKGGVEIKQGGQSPPAALLFETHVDGFLEAAWNALTAFLKAMWEAIKELANAVVDWIWDKYR